MDIFKAFVDDNINYNINILGSIDEPLFQANQIAELFGIKNVSQCVSKYNETEKVYKKIQTNGGLQELIFLTELGLYNMAFWSKKPFANKFKVWVFKVIKEIRINGRYELETQIKIKEEELNEEKNKEVEIERKLLHLIKKQELNSERKILQLMNENEKLRIKNEENRIKNETLRIEKDIKKIELMNQNPSLTILFNQENKQQEINNTIFEKIDKIEITELNNLETDEDDEIYQLSAFREKKYTNRKVPKVQQYHPETLEYIKTFNSIIETVRYFCNELHIETFSNKTLKDAFRGNYVYSCYRWNIIDYDTEDKPYKIHDTVKVFKTRRDLLARINLDKTKILEVYPSQKHAAIAMKHNSASAICKALKLDTISQGHYWKFYDDCDEKLKIDFIKNDGIIQKIAKTITCAKPIKQIDFETKKVIATYLSIKDVQVKYNISRASLKNAIDNKTPDNGFYWNYAS